MSIPVLIHQQMLIASGEIPKAHANINEENQDRVLFVERDEKVPPSGCLKRALPPDPPKSLSFAAFPKHIF